MERLVGTIVPLVTPFRADGSVDKDSLLSLCHFLLEKGVDGLFVCGTTGEVLSLSYDERIGIAETVIAEMRGRLQVCIQVSAPTNDDTLRLAREAVKMGADAIAAVSPFYSRCCREEIISYYECLAREVPDDFPVYLYNIPANTCSDIEPEVVWTLASRCPNIVGIKNTMNDLLRNMQYLSLGLPRFDVLLGCDSLIVPGLLVGCAGFVSSDSNAFPEIFVNLRRLCRSEDWSRAVKEQYKVHSLIKPLKDGASIAHIKESLFARGIIQDPRVRRPLLPVPDAGKDSIRALVREYETAYTAVRKERMA